jgi:hypothetical protein
MGRESGRESLSAVSRHRKKNRRGGPWQSSEAENTTRAFVDLAMRCASLCRELRDALARNGTDRRCNGKNCVARQAQVREAKRTPDQAFFPKKNYLTECGGTFIARFSSSVSRVARSRASLSVHPLADSKIVG